MIKGLILEIHLRIMTVENDSYFSIDLTENKIRYSWSLEEHSIFETDEYEFNISENDYMNLISELKETEIKLLPEYINSQDGTAYELNIYNECNSVTYLWWEEPPVGWEILEKFAKELVRYFEKKKNQEQP